MSASSQTRPCRNKSKSAVALSVEEQEIADKDEAFLQLIIDGKIAAVKTAISEGQMVDVGDENGESACHKAMRVPDIEMIKTLVNSGAFADYVDDYGNQPIKVGMQMSELAEDHIAYLLSLKDATGTRIVNLKSVNFKTGHTLIHDAAWIGNTYAATALLKTGEFSEMLEAANKQGQTAMHLAAFRAPKALVTALVDAGADPTAEEKNGRRLSKETPEMMAMAMGREDTANYLRDLNTTMNAVKFGMKMKKGAKKVDGAD